MKDMLKFISALVMLAALMYFAGAFAMWKLDAGSWPQDTRTLIIIGYLMFTPVCGMAVYLK